MISAIELPAVRGYRPIAPRYASRTLLTVHVPVGVTSFAGLGCFARGPTQTETEGIDGASLFRWTGGTDRGGLPDDRHRRRIL